MKTIGTMAPVHDPEYQSMLRRLRDAREAMKLTQVQVAERLGKPQSYVSKVESGERRIDPVELARLAEIYRRPVAYFLSGT
jgi:transcriptional regulator with XRE-family HTH domain